MLITGLGTAVTGYFIVDTFIQLLLYQLLLWVNKIQYPVCMCAYVQHYSPERAAFLFTYHHCSCCTAPADLTTAHPAGEGGGPITITIK